MIRKRWNYRERVIYFDREWGGVLVKDLPGLEEE